ncbi:hypothetical protein CRG93_08375 [Escherichia sp. E2593]|nr:hypothetical protein CRG93_08375 [Escherichia sp. E2593]
MLIANIFFFSCGLYGGEIPSPVKLHNMEISSTSELFNLSENQRYELDIKSEGGDGDGDASYRLHQYYTYVCFNIPKQIKYLARAASQGNITAQCNYAMILSSEEDDSYLKYYNLDNAINWMKMAASHGYIKAEVELLRLERLKETMRLGKDHPMP